ncbi:MAG: tetratricopeptide repeat protein [Rhodothermales bacterium]|nr:tetratricopeptide repeat protein [Rhodothermales bacterium]
MTIRAGCAAFLPITAALFLISSIATGETPDGISSPDAGPMLLRSPLAIGMMEEGRELLLRFRIDESEDVFYHLSRQPDGKAAAYYFLAYSSLLKLLVSDDVLYHDEFVARTDSLDRALLDVSDSPWSAFFSAESELQQSIFRAKRGKYIRAALAGRKAFRRYDRLVRDYPDFHEAYKGLGLIHVAVGSLPGVYRTVLGILGVHGTVEDGLRDLRVAADSSTYGREEAAILLSILGIVIDTGTDAGALLTPMYARYGDSPLFGHLYGFYLYSERQSEAALPVLQQASRNSDREEYFDLDYVEFYLADTFFRLDRYDEAIVHFQRYLDRHRGSALKALASLGMGLSLEMIGQRMAALSFYEDVVVARDFDSDRAARRWADRLLQEPLTELDRQLLAGRNAFDSGRYDLSARILEGVVAVDTLDAERRAQALYRLGRSRHVTGSEEEALKLYLGVMQLQLASESRWAPWSSYYAGRIHESAGRNAQALEFYERALAYGTEYDYRQSLEKNVKVARERLTAGESR